MKARLISIGIKPIFFLLISISILLIGCDRMDQQTGILPTAPAAQAHAMIDVHRSDSGVTGAWQSSPKTAMKSHSRLKSKARPPVRTPFISTQTVIAVHPTVTSAGGHWNPTGVAHGKWGEGEFHLGDIGNIAVGEDGTGSITLTTDLWEIGTGSDVDIVGKGIIVHAGADDFTSQPSGAAGARIGCGVIVLSE